MDKEVEQILKKIEESLVNTRDFRREHWTVIPVEQAQFPHPARAVIDIESG